MQHENKLSISHVFNYQTVADPGFRGKKGGGVLAKIFSHFG